MTIVWLSEPSLIAAFHSFNADLKVRSAGRGKRYHKHKRKQHPFFHGDSLLVEQGIDYQKALRGFESECDEMPVLLRESTTSGDGKRKHTAAREIRPAASELRGTAGDHFHNAHLDSALVVNA